MVEKTKVGNFILLGPPGAGKGTQAQVLAKELNLEKIDTGNLIRQAIKEETPLGIEAKKFVTQGKLVTDQLVINLILEEIEKVTKQDKNFLLDGFPRNLAQANALDEALTKKGIMLNKAISIQVDSNKLVERITGRRLCTNKACGAVYHLKFNPPKQENICDLCGSALYQREDDKEELVQSRLNTYNSETSPLIEFYSTKGILEAIDGNKKSEEVSKEIFSKV
ncbi:MAG: adenylate kinase [Candidatus Caenarcaniphilales bacterium]|nr:adenylate kinase [Candidatus Caenarcaniphilales bacterium]